MNEKLVSANFQLVDHNGDTALHLASKKGHMHASDLLLRAGASLRIKNNQGKTPIDVAIGECSALFAAHNITGKGHDQLEAIKATINRAQVNTPSGQLHPEVNATGRKSSGVARG